MAGACPRTDLRSTRPRQWPIGPARVSTKGSNISYRLGVVVRGDDVYVGVHAHLLHLADDCVAVPRTQPGVDHERRLAADDDADVRDEADVEIRNCPDMLGELHRGVLPDERRGRGSLARRGLLRP